MNILLVSNLYPPDVVGGYELIARDLAEGLRERGHEVTVLTSGNPRPDDAPWVHRKLRLVAPFGEAASLGRVAHVRLRREHQAAVAALLRTKTGPFDVALNLSLRRMGLHVPRYLSARSIPSVYCFNDDWLLAHAPGIGQSPLRRAAWRLLERGPLAARTWRGAPIEDAVYISQALRTALLDGGAPVPEGVVGYQGVDPQLFPPRPSAPDLRAPRLLFVGRLHPTKAPDEAVRALALVRAAGLEATLTLVGAGEASMTASLRGLAQELGVGPFVHLAGFVPRAELWRVYHAHDVFLFPSRWEEPLGLTYMEAMACGVPVVATPSGGAAELLVDRGNALLAAEHGAMARAVLELARDPELAARLVAAGFDTLRTRANLVRYTDLVEARLLRAARAPCAVAS